MYWYKRNIVLALSIFTIAACKPEIKDNGGAKYFDLKRYFTNEAYRLSKKTEPVGKIVMHNNDSEEKKVKIGNWQRELALFTESDINKPSWRDSYTVVNSKDSITYTAIDTNLRTRLVTIRLDSGKVTSVYIVNKMHNLLYQTQEKLSYYPDYLYQIEKRQHVKILGGNNYLIRGVFATPKKNSGN